MKAPQPSRPIAEHAEPLWDRIDRNRYLLALYLIFFALLGGLWFAVLYWLIASAFAVLSGDPGMYRLLLGDSLRAASLRGLAAGFVLTATYEWYALASSEKSLLRRMNAVLAPKGDQLAAKMALKDMAIAAGLPVAPAFYVLPSTNVNALVSHPLGRRPVVAVTAGLLDKLTIDQQRAVYANLVARIRSGDARVSTAIAAIMAPFEAWRAARLARQNESIDRDLTGGDRRGDDDALTLLLIFAPAMVLLAELISATNRRSQLRGAEKADAEGMLLLKDPGGMLSALERCIWLDNVVPEAGEGYAQLFYCWSADSTNDEDDPEWTRVHRLREVLGVEGLPAA